MKSMIHFQLNFVRCKVFLDSFFSHVFVSCSVTVEKTVLSLLKCQRSVDYIYVGLFLGSLFCCTDLFVLSLLQHCPDYGSSVVCQSSSVVLHYCLAILGLFVFHINFKIGLLVSTE